MAPTFKKRCVLLSDKTKHQIPALYLQRGISALIVILIAAIVTISVFGALIPDQAAVVSRIQIVNSKRLANISLSLRRFTVKNGRLPCPAPITISKPNVLYGVENGSTTASLGGPGDCVPDGGVTKATNTVIGAVPWVTLGLSEENSVDAFGHRIEYMVLESATGSTIETLPFLIGEIKSYSGTPVSDGAAKTGTSQNQLNACSTAPSDNSCNQRGIFALIMRGANAYGAYTDNGSQLPLPTAAQVAESPGEAENLNGDLKFVSETGLSQSTFDDMVIVQSSSDFIAEIYQELSLPPLTAEKITKDRVKKAFAAILSTTIAQKNTSFWTKYVGTKCDDEQWTWQSGTVCPIGITPDKNGDGQTTSADSYSGNRTWLSGNLSNGALPYKDLGIPAAEAKDGWGKPLVYGVNAEMVADIDGVPRQDKRGISATERPRQMKDPARDTAAPDYIPNGQGADGIFYNSDDDPDERIGTTVTAFDVRSAGADGILGTADDIYMQVTVAALRDYFTNAGLAALLP